MDSEARIIQGDALECLTELESETFAVAVTSPPYNVGYNAAKAGPTGKGRWAGQYAEGFSDLLAPEEYVEYHRAVLGEIMRVLKPEGLLWYVHQRRADKTGRVGLDVVDQILADVPVRQEIVWAKKGGCFNLPTGGKKDCPVRYLANSFEMVWLIAKTDDGRVTREVAKLGNVWEFERERNSHPAPFPVELAARCISGTACVGPVLDPFCGSGSAGVAAQREGRGFLGIDRAGEYVTLSRQRVS